MSIFIAEPSGGTSRWTFVVGRLSDPFLAILVNANDHRPTTSDFLPSLLAYSLPASLPAISSGPSSPSNPALPGTLRRRGFHMATSIHSEPPAAALLPRRTGRLRSRRSRAGRRTPCNRSGRSGTSTPVLAWRVHCAATEVRRPPAARHRKSSRCPETSTPENSYAARDLRPLLRGAGHLSRAPTAASLAERDPEHRCAIRPLLLPGVPASLLYAPAISIRPLRPVPP